jgi:glycosyltransferase involved in cell wall biosynthesis
MLFSDYIVSQLHKFHLKIFVLKFWKFYVNLLTNFGNLKRKIHLKPDELKVFYGGGLAGYKGGPKVKIQRLQKIFPSKFLFYNVVYVLSNYPYLTENSLKRIKSRKIPIVINQNGVYFKGWYGADWEVKNYPNKIIYSNADYVFWQSEFARRAARKFLSPIDPPGEVLYNAVDLEIFKPQISKIRKNNLQFLIAGNFSIQSMYQIKAAIEASSYFQSSNFDSKLIIAGCSKQLQDQVIDFMTLNKIKLNMEFFGNFDQNLIIKLMDSSDAFFALKYMDTCPNIVIEAMAMGLPIIYSKSGGTPEIVGEHAGVGITMQEDWDKIPNAPDPKDIFEAMNKVIDYRAGYSEASRTRAIEKFGIEFWYQRHSNVFESMIDKFEKFT